MSVADYLDWLLGDDEVKNILDEPIPDAVKKRLLKSLAPRLPRPIPPSRKRKLEKRGGVLQEFDPLHAGTKCKLGLDQSDQEEL